MDRCSCCSKELMPRKYIILGKGVVLCDSCMDVVVKSKEIINKDEDTVHDTKILKPSELKKIWDEYVIGQQRAKKILSVAVYNHYKRLELRDSSIKKSNVLLVGPTGSGKTYLVQVMAKALDVPLVIADATTLTEAGYIGDDVEVVLEKLLMESDGDVERAQRGIVFIDEIDKISSVCSDTEKKVGGKGVQQSLLKLLEGTKVDVAFNKNSFEKESKVTIDTSQILFICGGAFPEIEEIIKRRIKKSSCIGYCINEEPLEEGIEDNILLQVTVEDLREFGMIPEFLGRLPVMAPLESISVESLKRILSEPKDCLVDQYKKLFEYDGINIRFEEDALTEIAKKAYEQNTGARSLRSVMEDILLDVMFEAPDMEDVDEFVVEKEFVKGTKCIHKKCRADKKLACASK